MHGTAWKPTNYTMICLKKNLTQRPKEQAKITSSSKLVVIILIGRNWGIPSS